MPTLRGRDRLKQLGQDYANGKISLEDLSKRLQSWEAHLKHADSLGLRRDIAKRYPFYEWDLD